MASNGSLKPKDIESIKERLLILHHASTCAYPPGKCPIMNKDCHIVRRYWENHYSKCNDKKGECRFPHCVSSRRAMSHFQRCRQKDCEICVPVRRAIHSDERKRGKLSKSASETTSNINNSSKGQLKEAQEDDESSDAKTPTISNFRQTDSVDGSRSETSSLSGKKRGHRNEEYETNKWTGKKRRQSIDTAGSPSIADTFLASFAASSTRKPHCTLADGSAEEENNNVLHKSNNENQNEKSPQEQLDTENILRHDIYSPPHSPLPQSNSNVDTDAINDNDMSMVFDLNFTFSGSPGGTSQN